MYLEDIAVSSQEFNHQKNKKIKEKLIDWEHGNTTTTEFQQLNSEPQEVDDAATNRKVFVE